MADTERTSEKVDSCEWAYLLLHRAFIQQCPGVWGGESLPDVGIHCVMTQVPKLKDGYARRSFDGIYVAQLS